MANVSEIKSIMLLLNEAYPDSKYILNKTLIDLWVAILGKYDITVLKAATVKLIAESSFVPRVADVVKQVKTLTRLGHPTAAEAWGIVAGSLREYGYYEQQKGRESLPPMIRRVVDQIGYTNLCVCEQQEIIRAQFMRMYHEEVEREQELLTLPSGVGEVVRSMAAETNGRITAAYDRLRASKDEQAVSIGKLLTSHTHGTENGDTSGTAQTL